MADPVVPAQQVTVTVLEDVEEQTPSQSRGTGGNESKENPEPRPLKVHAPEDGVKEVEDGQLSPFHERLTFGAFHTVKLAPVPKAVLEWNDVQLHVPISSKKASAGDPTLLTKEGKTFKAVLRGCTGFARPGELLAIMGASGAGKSSLLNVLARRNCKNTGTVTINGQPLTSDFASVMSYIQQDDLFLGNLTVREHLYYQARLRKPVQSEAEIEAAVTDVILKLGLSKAQHSVIGSIEQNRGRGISGGERKRLAVASELITNPSLMFVDEPTTGLDAYMAEGVMQTIKAVANAGRTVVCTIHQPSSDVWALFDRVCFMCDGKIAFFGDRDDAVVHFSRIGYSCPEDANPADFLIKTLALVPAETSTEVAYQAALAVERNRIADITNAWDARISDDRCHQLEESERAAWAAQPIKPPSRYVTSWWQQFSVLIGRAARYEVKDPMTMFASGFQCVVLSLVIGIIYLRLGSGQTNVQDRNGALFFIVVNECFGSIFPVLQTFPFESAVVQRDFENGAYSVSAYYLAKVLASFIPQILFPVIFTTINYWMIGFGDSVVAWLWCMLIIFLVAQVASSAGYVVSLVTPNVIVALAVAPAIMMPALIFGGLFINIDDTPVYFVWLQALSFIKYAYSACSVVVWDGAVNECPPAPGVCPFPTGESVLSYLGFEKSLFARDLLVLAAMIVALRFIAYVALWRKAQRRQNE